MRAVSFASGLLAAALLLVACAGPAPLQLAPESDLPAFLAAAAPRVREAYRFALSNPGALKIVPCYCGCGGMGHDSNLACFVQQDGDQTGDQTGDQNASQGAAPVFDQHGAGCGICVDIAQDVMRLSADGQRPSVIRMYVDAAYGHIAPGTDTPLP